MSLTGFETLADALRRACRQGERNQVMSWLLSGNNARFWAEEAFREACDNGHLELAQELVVTWPEIIDVRARDDAAFRWARAAGHRAVAQWLQKSYAIYSSL